MGVKSLIVYIVIAVGGYQFPVEEFGRIASQVRPIGLEIVDLANPQGVETFNRLHYRIVKMKLSRSPVLFLHAAWEGVYSGGQADIVHRIANVGIVPDNYERNLQVALHEFGHTLGMRHVQHGCWIMSPQPCGFSWDKRNLKRARRARVRK